MTPIIMIKTFERLNYYEQNNLSTKVWLQYSHR